VKDIRPIPPELDALASALIESAFQVHRELGAGLLESVDEACLCHELSLQRIPFERQLDLPVRYRGILLDAGLRIDLWIDRKVIVELKAVEEIHPAHEAQLLTYMKLSGSRLGFLINFGAPRLKDGILRRVL